jgi:hypothetical protein
MVQNDPGSPSTGRHLPPVASSEQACEARPAAERGMRATRLRHASEAGDDARRLVFDVQAPVPISGFSGPVAQPDRATVS